MKKNDIIMLVSILGGGYLAYWYLTKNGPNGAAYNAAGQKIAASYWDTWFGGSLPPLSTGPPVQTGGGGQVILPGGIVTNPTPPPTTTPPYVPYSAAPQAFLTLRDQLYAASGNAQLLGPDQWSYYLTQTTGTVLTPAQFVTVAPGAVSPTDRGPSMTVDEFVTNVWNRVLHPEAPALAGVGDIVPLPRSMSFSSGRTGMQTLQTLPMRGKGRGFVQ